MTALATTFRTNAAEVIRAGLVAAALVDDGFQIVPGRLTGHQTDVDRGSIWIEHAQPEDGNLDLELLYLHVRVFKRFYVRRGTDLTPYDPTPLENIAEAMQTLFNAVQTAQGPWYLTFESWDIDLDTQSVEVVYVGVNQNLYRTTA